MADWLRRALLGTAAIAAACLAVLAGTGWWLATRYRPGASREPGAPFGFGSHLGGGAVHESHVVAAIVLQASTVVGVALLVVALVRGVRSIKPVTLLGSVLVGLVTVLGFTTSRHLRWDQLALWAVTVGTDIRGIWGIAFSDQIRFILMPGEGEVSTGTYKAHVLAHMATVPILMVAAILITVLPLVHGRVRARRGIVIHPAGADVEQSVR